MTSEEIEAISWKIGYAQGFSTRNGEITAWPKDANGGRWPTSAEVAAWTAEYRARTAVRTVASLSRAEKDLVAELMMAEWLIAHPGQP